MKTLATIGAIALLLVIGSYIIRDYNDRIHEHDRYYCQSVEGYSCAECLEMGR